MYANENSPLPVVERLRTLGRDVLTTDDAGNAGQDVSDEDVLAFAANSNRILLTLNRKHFVRLRLGRPDHAGIIVCTFDIDFERRAQRICEILEKQPAPTGRLFRVGRPAT